MNQLKTFIYHISIGDEELNEAQEKKRCETAEDLLPIVHCPDCKQEKGADWQYCWNMACKASPAYDEASALKLLKNSKQSSTVSFGSSSSGPRTRAVIGVENKSLSEILSTFDSEAPITWLGRKNAPKDDININIGELLRVVYNAMLICISGCRDEL